MLTFIQIMNKYKNKIRQIRSKCGIYFLIKNNEIVYVGKSVCIEARVAAHRSKGEKAFDNVIYFECPEEEVDQIEKILIGKLQPKYNKTYTDFWAVGRKKSGEQRIKEEILQRVASGYYSKKTLKMLAEVHYIPPEELEALTINGKPIFSK